MIDGPLDTEQRRRWLLSIAGFALGTRLLVVAVLAISAARSGGTLADAVTNYDGLWYRRIAENGYPPELPTSGGSVLASSAGFFPLFPLLVRPFLAVGVPFWVAATVLAVLCAVAAAVLVALVVERYAGPGTAWLTAACWSVFPSSGVLGVAYSEALFTALAAGCLWCLLCRSWLTAGVLAALAGAARPTGVVVVAAVGVAVAVAVVRDREWRSLLAALVAPLGTLAALGWIGWRAGRLDAWVVTESQGWQVRFDGGWTFLSWAVDAFRGEHGLTGICYVLLVLGLLVLAVLAALEKPPPAVLTYLVLGTVLALGQGGKFHLSGIRFLLPIFPLLVPAGRWLLGRPPVIRILVLGTALALSAALAAYYFVFGTAPP